MQFLKKETFLPLIFLFPNFTLFSAESLPNIPQKEDAFLYLIPAFFVSAFFISLAWWTKQPKKYRQIGFLSITPNRKHQFYPLLKEHESINNLVKKLCGDELNVYSDLEKITLTKKDETFTVEDKNYKHSMLINRRRYRKYVLNHADIIDMGELTMMFVHPNEKENKKLNIRQNSRIRQEGKASGKAMANTPYLIPFRNKGRNFILSKNINIIGRSDLSDVLIKSNNISWQHAKLSRVTGRYKLTDLMSEQGTFVNGRRISERFLSDGDEICFENYKFKFSFKDTY